MATLPGLQKLDPGAPNFGRMVIETLENLAKAISETDVTAFRLVREDLQAEMAIMAPIDTPVRNRLKRVPGQGAAHAFYRLEPTEDEATGAKFLGTTPSNAFFTPGQLPTSSNPNYKYVSIPYKAVGDVVQVTFFDEAAGRSYADIRAHALQVKMWNVALCEEWCILNGDSSVNDLMFDGLAVQVTETVDYSDFTGDYALFNAFTKACEEIAEAGGLARFVVYPFRVHSKLVMDIIGTLWAIRQQTPSEFAQLVGGFNPTSWDFGYGAVDLLKSRFLQQDEYNHYTAYVIDDQTLDGMNNGNVVQMVDLTPIGAVELGIIYSAYRTLVYEHTCLMVSCPAFQRKVINISV